MHRVVTVDLAALGAPPTWHDIIPQHAKDLLHTLHLHCRTCCLPAALTSVIFLPNFLVT
jgi:hypothetical protein